MTSSQPPATGNRNRCTGYRSPRTPGSTVNLLTNAGVPPVPLSSINFGGQRPVRGVDLLDAILARPYSEVPPKRPISMEDITSVWNDLMVDISAQDHLGVTAVAPPSLADTGHTTPPTKAVPNNCVTDPVATDLTDVPELVEPLPFKLLQDHYATIQSDLQTDTMPSDIELLRSIASAVAAADYSERLNGKFVDLAGTQDYQSAPPWAHCPHTCSVCAILTDHYWLPVRYHLYDCFSFGHWYHCGHTANGEPQVSNCRHCEPCDTAPLASSDEYYHAAHLIHGSPHSPSCRYCNQTIHSVFYNDATLRCLDDKRCRIFDRNGHFRYDPDVTPPETIDVVILSHEFRLIRDAMSDDVVHATNTFRNDLLI